MAPAPTLFHFPFPFHQIDGENVACHRKCIQISSRERFLSFIYVQLRLQTLSKQSYQCSELFTIETKV